MHNINLNNLLLSFLGNKSSIKKHFLLIFVGRTELNDYKTIKLNYQNTLIE